MELHQSTFGLPAHRTKNARYCVYALCLPRMTLRRSQSAKHMCHNLHHVLITAHHLVQCHVEIVSTRHDTQMERYLSYPKSIRHRDILLGFKAWQSISNIRFDEECLKWIFRNFGIFCCYAAGSVCVYLCAKQKQFNDQKYIHECVEPKAR